MVLTKFPLLKMYSFSLVYLMNVSDFHIFDEYETPLANSAVGM